MSSPESKTSTLRIVIYWMIVLIPLGWGVYESIIKSLPLFSAAAASTGARDSAGS
jgi:hypothetical protein